ncbi:MAG: PIN domain-containing protein [Planctomycetota bacterium]
MICVDTSVWIEALRTRTSREATELFRLLDRDEVVLAAPVRIEILSGTRPRDYANIRRVLTALPVLIPTPATWQRIDEWIDPTVRAGDRFGVADLLIAAIAAENDALLWSKDSDFDRMAALGFIRLHR